MTGTDLQFYATADYWIKLAERIRSTMAGDRILLMSMTFEPTEPEIATIMQEIERAAARGVTVSLAIDAHSFLLDNRSLPGPLWSKESLPDRMPVYFQNKLRILQKLNTYPSANAAIINIPARRFDLPIAGRSHIKAAIINDDVFIGGCNLDLGHNVDLMAHWKSAADADKLHALLDQVIHGRHTQVVLAGVDRRMQIDAASELLIDAGTRGKSVIFDEALRLIDSAEEWLVITCQYFPNSITARKLAAAAKRGVKVEVIYGHPKQNGLIGGMGQHINILREKTRIPKELFKDGVAKDTPLFHAKLIACDKGFMIGSHNYIRAGVMLGTAEITLRSNDAALARKAVKTLHQALKNAKPAAPTKLKI